ncbi:Molybdenum cofactor sulfurase, partial [Cymbomonas tetramitiformis]
GKKADLELVNKVKAGGMPGGGEWRVLLDAAKACATDPPDLTQYPADFVALSFYKIFGYPSGLGALLVRRDAVGLLERRYFGGGTVSVVGVNKDLLVRREAPEGFEDGTVSFLSIAALVHGAPRHLTPRFPEGHET